VSRDASLARSLRVMAIVRWVLLALVASVAAGTVYRFVLAPERAAAGPDRFYCPMHPQIRSAARGSCPICYMSLEPIPEERGKGALHDAGTPHDSGAPHDAAAPKLDAGTQPPGLADVMLTLERRQSIGVGTAAATRRAVSRELRLPTVIEAPERAVSELRVRTPGFVERVAPIETGQRVAAGTPLVYLYSPEILRAEEELFTAQRLDSLAFGADAGSARHGGLPNDIARSAEQRLSLLGVDASDIERIVKSGKAERVVPVRAPSSGIVTARNVAVGTYATPEMMLFQITDLSKVWATATVAPEDLTLIRVGMQAEFSARGRGAASPVEATLVEPLVAAETRTGRVRFVGKNTEGALRPGDIGEIRLTLPSEERLLVPRDAVIDHGTFRYVFVEQAHGVFSPRVVEVGPLFGDERAVTSGLEDGARVVTRGAFLLDSESRLEASLAPAKGKAP
jgi:Cu(I)/Ag(I) efflux system membrane fusion protein